MKDGFLDRRCHAGLHGICWRCVNCVLPYGSTCWILIWNLRWGQHDVNCVYMVSCSVFLPPTPPNGMGPQVAPPSLLFASYWQHFWGPPSYLLGLCCISDYRYLLDDLRSTHTPSKYLRATYSHIYMCYVSTSYIYIYIHTYYRYIYIYIYTYTVIYIYVHIYIYIHTHIYIYTCIHIFIYIYINFNICIYIYICAVPHPHHTTGGGGQYHTPTTPQGGRGTVTMGDPWPWPGGWGGLERWTIYTYIYLYLYLHKSTWSLDNSFSTLKLKSLQQPELPQCRRWRVVVPKDQRSERSRTWLCSCSKPQRDPKR